MVNPDFSNGKTGWTAGSTTTLSVIDWGADKVVKLKPTRAKTNVQIRDTGSVDAEAGASYAASVEVRANKASVSATLRAHEYTATGSLVTKHLKAFTVGKSWKTVTLEFTTGTSASKLDLSLLGKDLSLTTRLYGDDFALAVTAPADGGDTPVVGSDTPVSSSGTSSAGVYSLSDGCMLNARGVGACGPLTGSAVGSEYGSGLGGGYLRQALGGSADLFPVDPGFWCAEDRDR